MTIGKDEVMEVLSDLRLNSIRFSAGPISINRREYMRVSDYIENGAITVKPTSGHRRYVPAKNILYLKDRDPRTDLEARSNVLHECTHIISDINKAKVTRLQDEAAAYLAQITFMKLLDTNYSPLLLIGDPIGDLTRICLGMVKKYRLGEPEGFGASIDQADIDTIAKAVQRHPEYASIKEDEVLDADGVGTTPGQLALHTANEMARSGQKSEYEGWLVSTMDEAQKDGPRKAYAWQALSQHFFMVYKPVAVELLARFATLRAGDPLSQMFNRFSADQKAYLVQQLKVPKPEG